VFETIKATLEVVNERGLHLRAAHVLAQLASKLEADVSVGKGTNLVNAKSLLGLTTLGATCGTKLDVVVTGAGARGAMEAIRDLFATGFYEGASQ
jgi:phosphocarrier protein